MPLFSFVLPTQSDGIVGLEFPGAVIRGLRESGRPTHVGKFVGRRRISALQGGTRADSWVQGPVFGTTTNEQFGSSRTEQLLGETQLCFISDTTTAGFII